MAWSRYQGAYDGCENASVGDSSPERHQRNVFSASEAELACPKNCSKKGGGGKEQIKDEI